jgi:hypothetical protein
MLAKLDLVVQGARASAVQSILEKQNQGIERMILALEQKNDQILAEMNTDRTELQAWQNSEKAERCMKMLRRNDYRAEKDKNPIRESDFCRWLLNSSGYDTWRNKRRPSSLWVTADPG